MPTQDIVCDSLCGPADERVIGRLEDHWECTFDPAYLRFARQWHGGIPNRSYFEAADGETYRVGRFLTLVDGKSALEPPFRPSWLFPERDIRLDWSAWNIVNEESALSQSLSYGEVLMPFAALYHRTWHPDDVNLRDCYGNLLAFLCDENSGSQVVVWQAEKAAGVMSLREAAKDWDAPVPYDEFTAFVAPDFESFLALLRPEA